MGVNMAIKIPSKHIYNMDNPKIRDNFIDNVEVGTTFVSPDNEFDVSVYNLKIDQVEYIKKNHITDIKGATFLISASNVSYELGAYIQIVPYITKLKIEIPKLLVNKYISELILGRNKEGNFNLSISTSYTVEKQPASAKFNYDTLSNTAQIKDIVYGEITEETETKTFVDINEEEFSITFTEDTGKSVTASVFETFKTMHYDEAYNLLGDENYVSTFDYFSFDISFLSGYEKLTFGGSSGVNYENWWDINGELIKYIPQQVTVTINGNTIGISLEDGTITYGSGTKPFSLDGNELLQESATTNGKLTTQHLADNILAQYKNGKETATLLCDIGEYYEEDGTKKIGIEMQDRMSFHEHDLVIPYVFGADGKDRPMSRYSNGEPKVFEVVSVKRFFDGAVWQELSLLEFTKTT
jgi:hypothetical protein